MSKSKSYFEIAIIPSNFELKHWSKIQNEGDLFGYLNEESTSGDTFD